MKSYSRNVAEGDVSSFQTSRSVDCFVMEVLQDEGTPLAECNRKDILLRLPEIDIYEWPRRVSGELLFQRPRPVTPRESSVW